MASINVNSIERNVPDVRAIKPAVDILGIPVLPHTMAEVIATVDSAIQDRRRLDIGVVNAAKIVNMGRDSGLADAVKMSDAIYADGMSVVWASRILGQPLPERIAGIDLMHGILQQGQANGYKVFCLGASADVLNKVIEVFAKRYPGVVICGQHHGYFDAAGEEQVAKQIRDSEADVLFVAITSPKKERFMARWADFMNVPVVHGVGGSFDVVAGLVQRAPERWQKLGLEWLYRVKQEPRRLWKRYLVTNVLFCKLIAVKKIRSLFNT